LIEENGIDPTRIFYVPNAPSGRARREKSDYLQKRLNVPLDAKVILYAGNISRWSMSAEIVKATAGWPNEYVLVIQSRTPKYFWRDKYLEKVIELADPKKVIISFEPVPQSEFRSFVDSADVGLAFYEPYFSQGCTTEGENIRLMGLSSGKIANYLYSGLPIIVNDVVIGPKEIVQSSNCGICVRHATDIKGALALIFDKYDLYVGNACRCFDQTLELEKHFTPVIDHLESYITKKYTYS
jgi:glycosyltransferase involved in cell wall biosynthesis